jgi:carboxypeptidase Taq
MKIAHPLIKKLVNHYQEISLLGKVKATLDWDTNVNLPIKGSEERAKQIAYLAELTTKLWLDASFRQTLEKANSEQSTFNEFEKAIVRNLSVAGKYYFHVPPEKIIEKERVTSEAFIVWREAREKNEFNKFLPFLKKIIAIDREIAEHLGYKKNPYDALLNLYEPELTAAYCEETFGKIKPALLSLVKTIQKSKLYRDKSDFISGSAQYPKAEQEKIGKFIMSKMGYDFGAGRMDISPHPFTTALSRHDVRLTTRYNMQDFRESYTSCVHEAGHALYEQGVNTAFSQTPLEHGVSYGIHEAMSRFWENMVGRNAHFLTFMTPIFQSLYPEQLQGVNETDIVRGFNLVKPSLIRIEADEVTYSLHIILRFEMENDLINGKLAPADAPEAWREKSKKYFGISPEMDSDGVLQDVHWTYGAFGYFPSYALGNLYGAQCLYFMSKEVPVDADLKKGELKNIKKWLDDHIHTFGSLYYPEELMKRATGKKLDPQYFIDYLTKKYLQIYSL